VSRRYQRVARTREEVGNPCRNRRRRRRRCRRSSPPIWSTSRREPQRIALRRPSAEPNSVVDGLALMPAAFATVGQRDRLPVAMSSNSRIRPNRIGAAALATPRLRKCAWRASEGRAAVTRATRAVTTGYLHHLRNRFGRAAVRAAPVSGCRPTSARVDAASAIPSASSYSNRTDQMNSFECAALFANALIASFQISLLHLSKSTLLALHRRAAPVFGYVRGPLLPRNPSRGAPFLRRSVVAACASGSAHASPSLLAQALVAASDLA